MKEQRTNTSEDTTDKEDGKSTGNKQYSKTEQANQSTNTNAPDWLMHLLTGAGALGGNYLLFIKPLQEKFDSMIKSIEMLEKKMEDQETLIELLNRKIKKTLHQEEDLGEQKSDDLFTVKNKSNKSGSSNNENRKTVRF